MTFTNPALLWGFLLLVPLAAIYLLKIRPNRKQTTAYFLWQSILKQKRSQQLFRRLRDLLSLMLMLLAFSAVVLSMAGLRFRQDDSDDLVLFIDQTVSMNAREGGSTRLELAKQKARQIVRALGDHQRCSVATVSDRVQFLSNLTDNPRELLNAIDRIQSTSLSGRSELLLPFSAGWKAGQDGKKDLAMSASAAVSDPADAATDVRTGYRLVLLTDGGLDPRLAESNDAMPAQEKSAEWEVIPIGEGSPDNVGLIASDIQRLPGGVNRAGLFFQLASSFSTPVTLELELAYGPEERLVRLIPLTVQPGVNPAEVFQLEGAEPGRWQLRIANLESDRLPDDNVAYLNLPQPEVIRVAIQSAQPYFYENSVVAFQQAGGMMVLDQQSPQLTLCQSEVPAQGKGDLLIFQPDGESPWWEDVGEAIEVSIPRVVDAEHSLTRHLEAAAIDFVGARRLKVPSAAEVLVVSEDDVPLIYRLTRSGQTAVVVNMDPVAADFFLSARFPILIYSTATFLTGQDQGQRATYPTGTRYPVPQPWRLQEAMIQDPAGQNRLLNQDSVTLNQAGHYRMHREPGNAQESWIAVSVSDRQETQLPATQAASDVTLTASGWSPANWLMVLALLVLVGESLLYQRRKVG